MADALTQDQRAGQLTTPLGDDVLVLGRLTADEGLSELFEIRVEALSAEANLDFAGALGLGSTIKYTTNDNLERYFNGVMTEAHWAGASDDVYRYQFVLRPWLWLLTRTSDSRIFAAMTALDIVKQVFNDRGFSAFLDRTTVTPPTLEYCVQYRETDFNFVCRLMEEYGIYYYFVHSDGQHMLVFADAETSHDPISQLDALDFIPTDDGGRREAQFLASWSLGRRAQSGKYSLNDYDYNKPSANLLASSQKPGGYANDSMEIFDFPGDYNVQADGATLAKVKAEAAQSLDKRRYASGEAPSLFPGALVTLAKHPLDAENQKYLVTHCSHSVDAQTYRSGAAGAGAGYSGHYELMPSDRQFRAPIATRKPEVAGVQSALVVGASGEEIDVDDLGRVLVQFYWDRKKEMKLYRRVRVAQFWAGGSRGALFLPRIGDEVLVQYEEGDPDRPVVVGSVYNKTNTVPQSLPAKMTTSGILTRSSKGGGGYNMLLFDDTANSEKVKLRAQKDLMVKALNNETRVIGADQSETITGNLTQSVGQDKTVTVGDQGGGNYSMTAQKKIVLTVGNSSITIDPTGITLQAPTITLTADASISASAPSISISGDTEVDITSPQTSISA